MRYSIIYTRVHLNRRLLNSEKINTRIPCMYVCINIKSQTDVNIKGQSKHAQQQQ